MGVIEKFQPPAEKASDFFSWFSWLLLAYFRIYVAWVFLKSGMHKIGDWETTLVLFEYEYQVPLLNFELAAYLATFGELVLPVFLIVGLGTRQHHRRGVLLRDAGQGRRTGVALPVGLDAAGEYRLRRRAGFGGPLSQNPGVSIATADNGLSAC
jgi:hypothetical protein